MDRLPGVVPIVDVHEAGRIYDRSIGRLALIGALLGGVALGVLAYAVATGVWPIAGFGQFAAAGAAPAAFVGAGTGIALGGLTGALLALYRLPQRWL